MIGLFKKSKNQNEEKVLTCSNTPARLFFEILKTNDTSLLKVENHEEQFEKLYDEFYELRGNQTEKQKLTALEKLCKLKHKLEVLKLADELYHLPEDKVKVKINILLEKIGYKVPEKNPFQVFKQWIGILENEIEFTIIENNLNEKPKKIDLTFSEIIVAFENKLKRQISDNISIEKFIAYEKNCTK